MKSTCLTTMSTSSTPPTHGCPLSLSTLFRLHSLFIFFFLSINPTVSVTNTSLQTPSTHVPLFLHHNLPTNKNKSKHCNFFSPMPVSGENHTILLTSFTLNSEKKNNPKNLQLDLQKNCTSLVCIFPSLWSDYFVVISHINFFPPQTLPSLLFTRSHKTSLIFSSQKTMTQWARSTTRSFPSSVTALWPQCFFFSFISASRSQLKQVS